jgi:DNA-binding transcriptional LysR family regulator
MFMRQLTYLIALDKHRHFGRAADSCHVSQPALSNAIKELERELGIAGDFVGAADPGIAGGAPTGR